MWGKPFPISKLNIYQLIADRRITDAWISAYIANSPTFMAHPRSTASFPACERDNISVQLPLCDHKNV